MIRRLLLFLMLALAMVAALPAATSANHGEAHGGHICYEEPEDAGCLSGGEGEGGAGFHNDVDVFETYVVTESGGYGEGGLGGRWHYVNIDGHVTTISGGYGKGGGATRHCHTPPEGETECQIVQPES
jgi:hypothetical protein